jgi:hypothetical protein
MYLFNNEPRNYRHKRHSIERLSSSVIGPDGAYHWLVCPDRNGEAWYARSLADAREAIDMEVV